MENPSNYNDLERKRDCYSSESNENQSATEESVRLVERNCDNLLAFLDKEGQTNSDVMEYCKHILELIKSEFDYMGIKFKRIWKKKEELQNYGHLLKAKIRKYKNRCRVLESEVEMVTISGREDTNRTQLNEENCMIKVKLFE